MKAAPLSAVAEAMADEAWDVGNPDVTNAILIYQDSAGKVRALHRLMGASREFGESVMRAGGQLLDAPASMN